MTSAEQLSERAQEVVGPIVVKEVRQGLRARVFGVFFGLMLAACLVVAIIALATSSAYDQGGRDAFGAFLVALNVVCCFVIPYTAFRSMAREREDETWVLLALTGLGARSIVRGKWLSASAQAMLFASACAPFCSDLPQEVCQSSGNVTCQWCPELQYFTSRSDPIGCADHCYNLTQNVGETCSRAKNCTFCEAPYRIATCQSKSKAW